MHSNRLRRLARRIDVIRSALPPTPEPLVIEFVRSGREGEPPLVVTARRELPFEGSHVQAN